MKEFKASDKKAKVILCPQLIERGVWAAVGNHEQSIFSIGHIPTGCILNLKLTSDDAINCVRELADINSEFNSDAKFGDIPDDPTDKMIDILSKYEKLTTLTLHVIVLDLSPIDIDTNTKGNKSC